jgi:putative membrane protein
VLLVLAAIELGIAWGIARGLTDPTHAHMQMAGPTSHLALMAQLTLLGVLAPLLLAWQLPASSPGARPWARRQLMAATIAAPALMWFWHLPAMHDELGSGRRLEPLPMVTVFLTGLLFWRGVLGTGRRVAPPAARQIALVVAGQATALLGLALLLTTDPLHGGTDGLWGLSAVNDQRLAGLLMLVVDLGVTVPLLASLNAQRKAGAPQVRLRMPPERRADVTSRRTTSLPDGPSGSDVTVTPVALEPARTSWCRKARCDLAPRRLVSSRCDPWLRRPKPRREDQQRSGPGPSCP